MVHHFSQLRIRFGTLSRGFEVVEKGNYESIGSISVSGQLPTYPLLIDNKLGLMLG